MSPFAIWSVPIAMGLAYAPHIAKVVLLKRNSAYTSGAPRDLAGQLKLVDPKNRPLITRLQGSHSNQLEMLGVYAAGVAVATTVGVAPVTIANAAKLYIGSRVAYNAAYAAPQVGNGALRSLSFTGAFGAVVWMWCAAARAIA